MPIIEIEIVVKNSNELPSDLAQSLADASAVVLKSKVGGTWVKLRHLESPFYAENDTDSSTAMPVFVSLLLGKCGDQKERISIAKELTRAISQVTRRPEENVHILFEPEGIGRIAFGGKLLTT